MAGALIRLLIVGVIACGVWYVFKLAVEKLGAPAIVLQVLTVLVIVAVAVFALRFLGGLL